MPRSFGSTEDHHSDHSDFSQGSDQHPDSLHYSPTNSTCSSNDKNLAYSNEFLGFPELSLNAVIPPQFRRYSIPPKLPRPKEFYKKELEEIADILEKKFKQSSPYELDYVNSPETHSLFMGGLQLFQEILQYTVPINSDTFRAWVLIQRWSGRMQKPDVLYSQIKQLGIHRPSFRLCASILTSYANGSYQLAKREYIECAIQSLFKMKEHNYVPNTYVYNALFVMCNKNHLYREVWKFFIELILNSDPSHTILDGFTCASLMETCVAEQNPHKGKSIYDMFRQLPNTLKKNNEKYIAQLKSKLDDIYEEQSLDYNFPALHETWTIYSNHSSNTGGTSSQQSPDKFADLHKNQDTESQKYSPFMRIFQPTSLDNIPTSSPPQPQVSHFDDSRVISSGTFHQTSLSHNTWRI